MLKFPLVKVQGLSIAKVLTFVISSRKEAPINKITFLEAALSPQKYLKEIKTTRQHDQESTKKIRPL